MIRIANVTDANNLCNGMTREPFASAHSRPSKHPSFRAKRGISLGFTHVQEQFLTSHTPLGMTNGVWTDSEEANRGGRDEPWRSDCHNFGEARRLGYRAPNGWDLNFENYRQDKRALGSLLADVALEVHANFFLDDRPVGTFFGVRSVDGAQYDVTGTGDEVAAVVAHKTARHDFRLRFQFAGMFVDRNDGYDHAVFRKMFAFANHHFFNFLERTGID